MGVRSGGQAVRVPAALTVPAGTVGGVQEAGALRTRWEDLTGWRQPPTLLLVSVLLFSSLFFVFAGPSQGDGSRDKGHGVHGSAEEGREVAGVPRPRSPYSADVCLCT